MIEKHKYYFFWQGVFSQWASTSFVGADGVTYCTCEQAMMAAKALVFDDRATYERILATTNPREQKELGRQVQGFDPAIWNQCKFDIVVQNNYQRALADERFRTSLLATGDLIIVEASPYDRIWGIGYSPTTAPTSDPSTWGENLLGKALMKVRQMLNETSR